MTKPWKWLLLGVAAVVGVWLLITGGNTLARYMGWVIERQEPEALSAFLKPHYRMLVPEGEGPFPTGILLSGCDGPADNMDLWAETLNNKGWAALIVDSHTPRGYGGYEIWRLICAGQLLMGSERAGDALVALADMRAEPIVDPSRIVLLGASHGGWTIMELLNFEDEGRLPFNLSAWPEGISPDAPLNGVIGQVLLYPYCGRPNRAFDNGWARRSPTLFLLGDKDLIAPPRDCLTVIEHLEERGLPVDIEMFAGVDHGFDQRVRQHFSTLEFDPEATALSVTRVSAFLDELLAPVQAESARLSVPDK
ncbi:MAG: prolyl oligopeptidase family serine peptidase [Pseudomonadota bacterium]